MVKRRPYRPDVCAHCKAETWCEIRDDKAGTPQCRACKVERFFSNFLYPPVGLSLMGWQKQVIRDLYGTLNMADGNRQYQHGYVSVAKQNGKTFLASGLPLFHLIAEGEDETPEVYGCASAKDQAALVYKTTARLVRSNPVLLDRLKIIDSKKTIVKRDGNGFYIVLSADGDVQDGIRPSLLIRDEIHRWKTSKAKTLHDVTTKGQISRYTDHYTPLDIAITTAGAEYESPLWWGEYQHAKAIQKKAVVAPSYYIAIWEADAKKAEKDKDYWKSKEARIAANPSHEDLGGFLKDSAIVSEMEKAVSQPAEKSSYLRYHLNIPVRSQEDPIIEMSDWLQCDGGIDLREWPVYDYELMIHKWGLMERPCYAGVDASWTTDLTAVVFIFPPFADELDRDGVTVLRPGSGNGVWSFLPFFWVPKEQVEKLERVCKVPLSLWIEQGFVHTTPGPIIDQQAVIDRIKWGREMFDLKEVPYDRMNFRTEAVRLTEEGILAPEVAQNFMLLSAPTKWLLGAYVARQIRHANNPVLTWMAACLQLQYDKKDGCQPSKPERLKSSKRIDGMQAIITGASRALVAPAYTSQEIEVW